MKLKLATETQTRVWKNLRHCIVRGIFYTRFFNICPSLSIAGGGAFLLFMNSTWKFC
nr:MAG TPA: hypothetical protein [Caudoviricetes sp.]